MDAEVIPVALAFAAGVASFVSPCHLAVMPAYLALLGGGAAKTSGPIDRRLLTRRALLLILGFSLAMVALGVSVGLAGYLLWDRLPLLRKIGGVLLLVFGLHLLGLLRIPVLHREWRWMPTGRAIEGNSGAFVLGAVFGFGWTPCIGPILASILLLAASSATVWTGAVLLAAYAAGLGLPFLAVALLLGRTPSVLVKLRQYSQTVEAVTGSVLLVMGVLLYTNQFQRLAAILGTWTPL